MSKARPQVWEKSEMGPAKLQSMQAVDEGAAEARRIQGSSATVAPTRLFLQVTPIADCKRTSRRMTLATGGPAGASPLV